MLLALIVACEVAFWVLVAGGLLIRYLARRPRLGLVVLLLVPLVDVLLLVATAIHLRGGATADLSHALAACYLGVTLVYGHRLIHWLDIRFAHRFADGPAPRTLTGMAYARHCWADVARSAAAMGIASLIAVGLTLVASPEANISALTAVYGWSLLIIMVEMLWAISYSIFPRRAQTGAG